MTSKVLLHAFKWSMASEIASKAIQPLVFIVLARLLTPEDFGVMSAALMVIGFSQIFWEAGMGKALIQRQTDVEGAANAAFWINICLGGVIAAILYLTADSVARTFFQDERVTAVLQVMTLQVFLGAVSAVHTALLQKEMGFKRLFWVRFATVSLPGLAFIPLAWYGMGYWALVVGTLVGQAAQVIMLWWLSPWRPSWSFNTLVAKEMARFGAWVAFTGLMTWGYTWIDSMIVGMYFGIRELGVFRTGNQFAMVAFTLFFSFATPVLYSRFSSSNLDRKRIGEELFLINRLIPVISFPLAMFLVIFSTEIEKYLLGETWTGTGVGYVVAMIAIKEAVLWIFAYNIEAYRALGRPQLETFIAFLSVLANPAILIYFASKGFDSFIFGRSVVLGLLGVFIHAGAMFYFFRDCARVYLKIAGYFSLLLIGIMLGNLMKQNFDSLLFTTVRILLPILLLFYLIYFEHASARKVRIHIL